MKEAVCKFPFFKGACVPVKLTMKSLLIKKAEDFNGK